MIINAKQLSVEINFFSILYCFMILHFLMKKPINKNRQFVENFFANKGLQILVDLSIMLERLR